MDETVTDRQPRRKQNIAAVTVYALVVILCAAILVPVLAGCKPNGEARRGAVRIGAKNFTEQFILGELLSQLVEAKTNLTVERRFNLGGTMICHRALIKGEIDLYPEYTGTALTAILGREVVASPQDTYDAVAEAYRDRFACEWLSPFGFNNTYAITIRQADAETRNWQTLSDLREAAPSLNAAFTAEFVERPDGYPGLKEAYGFAFGSARELDAGLMYKALTGGEADVICAFATDGRIAAYKLLPLADDKGFFPPYFAAPVVRSEVLEGHPELREVLNVLAGNLDDATMQQLNYQVDEGKLAPSDVARRFLRSTGIVK